MTDSELIEKNYWEKFNALFPKIKKNLFYRWINEDFYPGWEDLGYSGPAGRRELKMLYATIRATKPKKILEIGTYRGDSANHILLACERNLSEGFESSVTLLDIKNHIDKDLHSSNFKRIIKSSIEYLPSNDYDFIVQDGSHNYQIVKKELELFKQCSNLKWVWAHDYYLPGRGVKPAWDELGSSVFTKWFPFSEKEYAAGFVIASKN
jgi:hypothetical protein